MWTNPTASLVRGWKSGWPCYEPVFLRLFMVKREKKENKMFIIYKEIQRYKVQSHIWLTASSYMVKHLRISSYIRKPFLIYDFAPDPTFEFPYIHYEKNFVLFFISVANTGRLWLLPQLDRLARRLEFHSMHACYLLSCTNTCSICCSNEEKAFRNTATSPVQL